MEIIKQTRSWCHINLHANRKTVPAWWRSCRVIQQVPCEVGIYSQEAMHKFLSKITGNAELEIRPPPRHCPQLDQNRSKIKNPTNPSPTNHRLTCNFIITFGAIIGITAVNSSILKRSFQNSLFVQALHNHSQVIQVSHWAHLLERPLLIQHALSVRLITLKYPKKTHYLRTPYRSCRF